jgi:lysosome membrane protein 2
MGIQSASSVNGRSSIMNHLRVHRCFLYCIGLHVFLILLAIIVASVVPNYIQMKVNSTLLKELPLRSNKSVLYSSWITPPSPLYQQYWFFDITNAQEVIEEGAKPRLRQLGPITYRRVPLKERVEFHPHNGTVSYEEKNTFYLVPHMTHVPLNTNFTNVNIPFFGFVQTYNRIKDRIPAPTRWIFEAAVSSSIFTTRTIEEVLYGYKDPDLQKIKYYAEMAGTILDPTFGLLYKKNNSHNARMNVYTGERDLKQFLHVHTWKDRDRVNIWTTNESNTIIGSEGSNLGPFMNRHDRIYIFAGDLCRSLYVEFVKESSVRGVPTYVFSIPPTLFANSTDNQGFCIPTCLISGVLNMSRCTPGAPLFMSQPHLYGVDDHVVNMVEGLIPNEEFKSYIEVDPFTGVVMSAQKKLQVNLMVEKAPNIRDTEHLPERLLMPYVWINESVYVDEKSAAGMRNSYVFAYKLAARIETFAPIVIILLLISTLLILTLLTFKIYQRRSKRRTKTPTPDETRVAFLSNGDDKRNGLSVNHEKLLHPDEKETSSDYPVYAKI